MARETAFCHSIIVPLTDDDLDLATNCMSCVGLGLVSNSKTFCNHFVITQLCLENHKPALLPSITCLSITSL